MKPGSKRVYISGPMRGYKLYNFPAFFAAAIAMRADGFEVICPAEQDMANGFDPSKTFEEQPEFTLAESFKRDFEDVLSCDGIVALPGWDKSIGAQAEIALAMVAEIPVYELRWVPDVNDYFLSSYSLQQLGYTHECKIVRAGGGE